MNCKARWTAAMVAAAAVAGLSSTAQAGDTEVINLGSFTLAGGQSAFVAYQGDPGNLDHVVGFDLSFDYNDAADPFAWASDLRVTFDGWGHSIGGYTTPSDQDYSWYTGVNTNTGTYNHTSPTVWADSPNQKPTLVGFTLTNDYAFNLAVQWNNVTVTLHKEPIPAPGALALLGMAGLVGGSRRRRA